MPLPSSLATMSPATSAATSGSKKTGQEQQHQHRRGEPRLGDLRGEDVLAAVVVALVEALEDDEDQRQDDHQAEAEVGALLGDQLAQLPAVDGQRGRARCGARARLGAARGELRRRCSSARHRRPRGLRRLSRRSPLPSVSRKNRSSSVASSGVSARIATPPRPSASDSSPTSRSSAWKLRPCSPAAACSMPGLRARQLQRARVVGGAQPVAGAALAAQVGERALVDDAPASRRSRRGRTVPGPRAAGGSRAAP